MPRFDPKLENTYFDHQLGVVAKRPGPPRPVMGVFFQVFKQRLRERSELTETQRRLYTAEKLENFRWISKLIAAYSKYKLSEEDLVCEDLCQWLREVGQCLERNTCYLEILGYPLG